jgi:alanine racemase
MARKIEATIDLDALRHNLACVRALAPQSRVLAVVKADAYGHGVRHVAPALADADALAVAHIDEALELRTFTRQSVVVLEGFLDMTEWRACLAEQVTPVIHQAEQLHSIEQLPPPAGFGVWIKIDTGMRRLGFAPGELPTVLARLRAAQPALDIVLMTHMARAEDSRHPFTATQIARFDAATAGLGLPASVANSAGLIGWPGTRREWVRPGLMLYGVEPSHCPIPLRPVMTLRSRVIALRALAAGEEVGYGGRWRSTQDTVIATVSAGYADGYPAQVPDGTPVLINGQQGRIAGRPSMDMISVDVGGLNGVRVGDEAILWGESLPVEQVAEQAGLLVYQLLTGVSKRVTRVATGSSGP